MTDRYQERAIKEHEDLCLRILKLEGFLLADQNIESGEKRLLRNQMAVMIDYRSILEARIMRFNNVEATARIQELRS